MCGNGVQAPAGKNCCRHLYGYDLKISQCRLSGRFAIRRIFHPICQREVFLLMAIVIHPAKKLFGHVLFWICYYVYDGPIASSIEDEPSLQMQAAAISLPVKIIATYFTIYLVRQIYQDKIQRKFAIYLGLSMLLFGFLQRIVSYKIIYPAIYPQGLSHPLFYAPKIIMEIFGIYSVAAIASIIYFSRQWYINQREKQQLQNEKLQAELKYLKAQVHPHFLFNTLNNLYSLTITDPQKAPEVVYKLSQLMSYMLYDSNKPFVPLQMEIEYIENYITLEKIRYQDRLDISLNILDELQSIQIAPLLILPFVENSFKHGFINDNGKVWIHLDILKNDDKLIIKVENSKEKTDPVATNFVEGGIGLTNVRKRLDLIYKDAYELQLVNEETFLVILKINIKPNDNP